VGIDNPPYSLYLLPMDFLFSPKEKNTSKHLFFTHAINPWEVEKPTGYKISQYTK